MAKPRQVDTLRESLTEAATEVFAKRFSKWKDPGGAIKMAFVRAWRNKQMKRLNWINSVKPHQGAKECERRRKRVAEGKLKI